MTLERISKHILDEARSVAEKLRDAAKKESEATLSQARLESEQRLTEDVKAVERDLQRGREQELAKLRTDQRTELLRLKTDILEQTFARAGGMLREGKEHEDWLRARLKQVSGKTGTILCRDEDRELLKRLMSESHLDGVSLHDQGVAVLGGWFLRTENYDLDMTLDAELSAAREKTLPELARQLEKPR